MNDENIENTGDETPGTDRIPTDRRPLGFWLRAVDGLISRAFAAAFQDEGVTRRDWMLLNALDGDVDPAVAERFARRPKRLRGLEQRGWIDQRGDGTWELTDEGRAAKARLAEIVDGVRARVAGAVPPDDFATTLASLEAIARELGWDESAPIEGRGFGRGFGRGRGFGPRGGEHGFRSGFGPGFHPGFGPGFDARRAWAEGWDDEDGCRGHGAHRGHGDGHGHSDGHGHGEHGHRHGHSRPGRRHDAEAAYARGFDAGYARGATGRA